jgi:large subunit ribosomal protein L35
MNKPIYRHLAHAQWCQYKRKVLVQRLTQMNAVPDVLPSIDPSVSTILRFGRKKVPHGDFVLSRISEVAPNLTIQPYDAGERLVSIAIVNPDVPDVEKDGFEYRCHFLASNIRLSPTETEVRKVCRISACASSFCSNILLALPLWQKGGWILES